MIEYAVDARTRRRIEETRELGEKEFRPVGIEADRNGAAVQMEKGAFLYESGVSEALAEEELELVSFEPPPEALVTVYEVIASGGG